MAPALRKQPGALAHRKDISMSNLRLDDAAGGDESNPRFPRTQAVLEAARVADLLRTAAGALDGLVADAPNFEPPELRRKLMALRLQTVMMLGGRP